jgi:NTP pyrophosphatase (non-canonical NTP hydrolase)
MLLCIFKGACIDFIVGGGCFMEKRSVSDLTSLVIKFRDERNWEQFHNLKDLALSLSLEASELLENFQWKSSQEALEENKDNIQDELADVLIYALLFANKLNLEIEDIIVEKIRKNNEKYPIEKAIGNKSKYTEF